MTPVSVSLRAQKVAVISLWRLRSLGRMRMRMRELEIERIRRLMRLVARDV